MAPHQRTLVLDESGTPASDWLRRLADGEVTAVGDLAEAVERLRRESFTAVVLADPALLDLPGCRDRLQRAEHILDALVNGVAVLDPSLRVTWVSRVLRNLCTSDPVGRPLLDALGAVRFVEPGADPFHMALGGEPSSARLLYDDSRYLDLVVTPARAGGSVTELVVVCRDVTREVLRQQKLDALYRAGRELTDFDPEQLGEMNVPARVELLKQNLRRQIHDLLHYDVIEVRLLDRRTGRLEPLLQEGMTPEAASRVLYARTQDNGVTGYVAATGQSYLCPDAASDPHFLQGSPGARSSMTVPLLMRDEVIGTFNVESPRLNAFGIEDLQFTELYAREVAQALNTLNLLSAQLACTASQSIEAVNREVALPADELLTLASGLLEQAAGERPEWVAALQKIIADAREIKRCILKVGDELAVPADDGAVRPGLKGKRILVVDSDERVRRSAHAILERQGCLVETAATATEGLALAKSGSFDAILADIRHPDMGGYEAYRRLKEHQPNGKVILTAAFGYDSSHTLIKARQDGLRFVLFKPFQPPQLFNALLAPDEPGGSQPEVIQAS